MRNKEESKSKQTVNLDNSFADSQMSVKPRSTLAFFTTPYKQN